MEKRLIIAISLSILIIIFFQSMFSQKSKTTEPVEPTETIVQKKIISAKEAYREVPFDEKEVVVETEKYVLTFTNVGGSLKNLGLREYDADLIKDAEGDKAVFSMQSNVLKRSLDQCEFQLIRKEKESIIYSHSVAGEFRVSKEYSFHNYNDYIELRILIENLGNNAIYRDYDLLGGSAIQAISPMMGRKLLEADSMIDGKIVRKASIRNGETFLKGIVSWTGVKERYFCVILKPMQPVEGVILKQFDKSGLASGIRTKRSVIYPGQFIEDSYILYMGPNDIKRLQNLGVGLEQVVNYGVFGGIARFLLATLRAFHKAVRNWGVAIIMLTFLINIVLFPLTRKSFLSMKKIQEVQPHIEKLRKVHKDNPQRLNKELAELYRQYNVNPFGGCLPLLIQMPIFIALYQGLIRSIELKGANFLWVNDLSNPDYVNIPFKLPIFGNQIHILPLLMVIAMFFQQKTSTMGTTAVSQEQKQQQKIMMIFFPVFFGFIFYNFPSGLVLYWLTNTVLMIIEHTVMRKSLGQ